MGTNNKDDFARYTAPARRSHAVDLSSEDFEFPDGVTLYVGGQGNVKCDLLLDPADATGQTFVDLVGFTPFLVRKVYKVGTTATAIIGLS